MDKTPAGWLTLNPGMPDSRTYELHVGKNRIGRVSKLSRPDIAISGDMMVSRNHAILAVKINERNVYEYWIADNEQSLGKPSTNGTFINNSPQRMDGKPQRLNDGDTIRCGHQILQLKTATYSVEADEGVKLAQKVAEQQTYNNRQGAVLRQKI